MPEDKLAVLYEVDLPRLSADAKEIFKSTAAAKIPAAKTFFI
jgi:hypothetical protein